ncbi:unnamed protein product [Adineta steineri]|uniref:Parafibromin n=2 Tax=Adineta steineri TaxID=433720 RepID=A0A814E598_9BILA|nr:unnamed protein product [Adineta steineri]CAF0964806.1 unnamed protein product [Adineta steineri]
MADALSLLRQFTIENREYTTENDRFVFNDLAYPKDVKTNYLVYGTGKDNTSKDYYTLESIVFLLKNVELQHANYVKKAAEKGIPAISRPDRKDLLSYLQGQTATADRVDKNAPLDITMQRPLQINKRPAEDPRLDAPKFARVEDDDMQKLKDRREKKFDEKNKELGADQIRPLSGELSTEAILKLRAKFRATTRDKIVDFKENEDTPEPSTEPLPITADTFEIMKRERTWRNRTTVLQSSNKNFAKDILSILNSIKAKEESEQKQEQLAAQRSPIRDITTRAPVEGYSRYNQEKFVPRDESEFKIDTHASYHGLTLKTVTEGATPNKFLSAANPSIPKPIVAANDKLHPASTDTSKRPSRTPIIIIPAALTSLITRYNCKELLEDLKYISTEDGKASGTKRDGDILIQRKKGNLTVPYRITDDPLRLSKQDWDERVVAVFAQGPAWQFKGWPMGGNPVEVFQKIKAYHIKWAQLKTDTNIAKWSVHLIELDQNKRHLDCARIRTFWDSLDQFIAKNKSALRY